MAVSSPVPRIVVATAAWSIPRSLADRFGVNGSGLERYASVFSGVEVNSTFYRLHKDATIANWASSVPETFRFAFKVPKAVTHGERLAGDGTLLKAFVRQLSLIGDRAGPLLVQLPPSLVFDRDIVAGFLDRFRSIFSGDIAFEPRHPSWLDAEELFEEYGVTRVLADPPVLTDAFQAVIKGRFGYIRLHGTPKIYYSSYSDDFIAHLAQALLISSARQIWCVFDNTASGAAIRNALDLMEKLKTLPDAARKTP